MAGHKRLPSLETEGLTRQEEEDDWPGLSWEAEETMSWGAEGVVVVVFAAIELLAGITRVSNDRLAPPSVTGMITSFSSCRFISCGSSPIDDRGVAKALESTSVGKGREVQSGLVHHSCDDEQGGERSEMGGLLLN